ncbi:hypothetical protein NKI79_11480 [Mesorhizobium sp. M0340]|uniref:hypothetical protein n=1 Tax=Mesorhizobium sp. M0340 TaxID=2956939 RepID=UPI00333C9E1D
MIDTYPNKPAIRLLALTAAVFLVSVTTLKGAYACNSGPDYCTDDPRIPRALADKKAQLAKDYPDRLVALLDLGVQCVARIQQSPDGFSLVIVKDGSVDTLSWDQDNENAAKAEIAAGTVKRFWIVNSRRAFSCDGQPSYDVQPDYDSADDVNTSLAIKCDNTGC